MLFSTNLLHLICLISKYIKIIRTNKKILIFLLLLSITTTSLIKVNKLSISLIEVNLLLNAIVIIIINYL